jgi:NAD+ kinase
VPFRQVALFGKPRAEGVRQTLLDIAGSVEAAGQTVLFDSATRDNLEITTYPGHPMEYIGAHADVAVVVGGDGTMLGIARELAPFRVPLIGINHGRLGFMTDVAPIQLPGVLTQMLAGAYEIDHRAQLEAEVLRERAVIFRARAVNDVVVSRGVAGGMVEFTVRVDGDTMSNQRADGVIVATPTGSTAYALSANGPILHPSVGGLVLVPVAPQTLSARPIVLPDHALIEIELTDVRDASGHFDMQSLTALRPGDVVRVRRGADPVTLLHPIGTNFFATLRQKLHWNMMPGEPHQRG